MTTDPATADYLRTIVRSQVMTERARDLLLKLIDDMQNELACRPVTAPKVEITLDVFEHVMSAPPIDVPYTGGSAQDLVPRPPGGYRVPEIPECTGGCSRGGEGPACGKPGCQG